MAQIAQAYFHFRTDLSVKQFQKFGRQVRRASKGAALNNFDREVSVLVDIEEGSVKGRVTVFAALLAGTSLIANYKGVKDSVKEICEDARGFGSDVCQKAINYAGVSQQQIYRVERRTKTSGKLSRLLSDIARLEGSVNELSANQMHVELSRLNKELQLLAKDLEPEDQNGLTHVLSKTRLPPSSKWPDPTRELPKQVKREEQIDLLTEITEASPLRNRLAIARPLRFAPKRKTQSQPNESQEICYRKIQLQ